MRIGFACAWNPVPQSTWSGVPWRMREQLLRDVELVDAGVRFPAPVRGALKAAYTRRVDGQWVTMWRQSSGFDLVADWSIRARLREHPVDALLQIQDLAVVNTPYFLVQDFSYDVLLDVMAVEGEVPHFPGRDVSMLRRRRDRQHQVYESASGLLALSGWFAGQLVALSGVPQERVHVVHPGINVVPPAQLPPPRDRRNRLLLVGKDFHTKGGDLVVAALEVLRREYDPDITLTVAGPREWPLAGDVPEGVRFLGLLPPARLSEVFLSHDLFVMPSRLEGFGIAFVEALAHGLPCIGRDAFAMPEIIADGETGALVGGDDPVELAERIAAVLTDDRVYQNVRDQRAELIAHYSWERVSHQIQQIVGSVVDGGSRDLGVPRASGTASDEEWAASGGGFR